MQNVKTCVWIRSGRNINMCFKWNAKHIFKIDVGGKEMFRDDEKGEPSPDNGNVASRSVHYCGILIGITCSTCQRCVCLDAINIRPHPASLLFWARPVVLPQDPPYTWSSYLLHISSCLAHYPSPVEILPKVEKVSSQRSSSDNRTGHLI